PYLFSLHGSYTTVPYTLSLHDALPISSHLAGCDSSGNQCWIGSDGQRRRHSQRNPRRSNGRGDHPAETQINQQSHRSGSSDFIGDRKSTRLNSSHGSISYAVFCLKKKK